MMTRGEDFLLTSEWSRSLFHDHAEKMPIIDFHCHLDPQQIVEDRHFTSLTQLWLNDEGAGDHYKWRLMRSNGAPETNITGDGDEREKYLAFVDAIERAPGNPLFEWSHLELRRIFDIDLAINRRNADEIWCRAQAQISKPSFSAKALITRFKVRCLCTTDDPVSDLRHHRLLAADESVNGFRVLPTFRPDALLSIESDGFTTYLHSLSEAGGIEICDFDSLKHAVDQRIEFFDDVGGRMADVALNSFHAAYATEDDVRSILDRKLKQDRLTAEDVEKYRTFMLLHLMSSFASHAWTMQLHMNCFRNVSSSNYARIGADAGFDSIGDQPDIVDQIRRLLDVAEAADALPRLILYSLNARDWLALASLAGSFQGGCRQRIHLGCAWWFNDTRSGMRNQITTYAEQSLLANFTGMLTDSRSFMSYPRHEYFRRVLCDLLGEWVACGRLPRDEAYLGRVVEDISYNNAHDAFGFFDGAAEMSAQVEAR